MASMSWWGARQSLTKEAIAKDVLPIDEIRETHPAVTDGGSIRSP